MATSTALSSPTARMLYILFAVLGATTCAQATDTEVTTSPEMEVPEWAGDSAMQLTLSSIKGGDSPLQYTVTPLTPRAGLNQSSQSRDVVLITGSIIAADASNYNTITQKNDVAYLSCDDPKDDSFIQPEKMLNDLMGNELRAIILYSTSRNWCSLSYSGTPSYWTIFSMADAAEASTALSYLSGNNSGAVVEVEIRGNTTNDQPTEKKKDGSHSAVAMSVLYSITGLITLLFLIIIASGAVRAHRYPERYGPRGALGGRPRQSRAKGLARAVLDTIPIVKFGNQTPAKPDPEVELETNTTDGRDATTQRTTSVLSDDRRPDGTTAGVAGTDHDGVSTAARSSQAVDGAEGNGDDQLGCSICTEDFKVGEDVRVLPCRHQFHPTCIDPWLINVSGTCPLCRYDLRPNKQRDSNSNDRSSRDGDAPLPPPLALDEYETEGAQISHRHRLSRIFDINRLRQASVEEQMAALRQMRAETNETEGQVGETETGRQRARLAERLRERFRIRTQAQSGEQRDS